MMGEKVDPHFPGMFTLGVVVFDSLLLFVRWQRKRKALFSSIGYTTIAYHVVDPFSYTNTYTAAPTITPQNNKNNKETKVHRPKRRQKRLKEYDEIYTPKYHDGLMIVWTVAWGYVYTLGVGAKCSSSKTYACLNICPERT